MNALTIRTKFFLGMALVSLSFILLSLLSINWYMGQIAVQEVENTLRGGERAFRRYVPLRYDLIATQARSIAQTPLLRAVMNISEVDYETVYHTARDLFAVIESDIMLLVDAQGKMLADPSQHSVFGRDLLEMPGVVTGLEGAEYSGIWKYSGSLHQVVVTPIVMGDQILGLLVVGETVDRAVAGEIREMTGRETLVLGAGRLIGLSRERANAPGLEPSEVEALSKVLALTDGTLAVKPPFRTVLGGEECMAVAIPLGTGEAQVVLFRALDEVESGMDQLRLSLLIVGLATMILTVILSWWLSSRVSQPIRQLSRATEELGAGNLSTQVQVHSGDEVGQLATTFNLMVSQIEERTKALQREIETRLEAEKRMHRSERYFRSLIENSSDLVLVVAAEGVVNYASPPVERLFGYQPAQVVGANLFDLVHSDDLERLLTIYQQCGTEGDRPLTGEFRLCNFDKSWHTVQAVFNNQLEEEAVAGIVINIQDITQRQRAKQQLAEAQKLEAVGQLAAGIAHEINSPMQFIGDNTVFLSDGFETIMGILAKYRQLTAQIKEGTVSGPLLDEVAALEADEMEELGQYVPESLQEIKEGIDRMRQIVVAMKDLSHPGKADQQWTELNRTIERSVTVCRNEWKYVAEVELDLDKDLPQVRCLPGDFGRVVINLVVNAAHAIEDASDGSGQMGKIKVCSRREGDWVEVRVSDSGNGIPEAVQPNIFNPFFTTKDVGKGTGQGLAIAHEVIAARHGGELFFETEAGQGTTFFIRVPVEGIPVNQEQEGP